VPETVVSSCGLEEIKKHGNCKAERTVSADVGHRHRFEDEPKQADEPNLIDRQTPVDDPADIAVAGGKQQRPGLQTLETVESREDSSPVPTVSGEDDIADRKDAEGHAHLPSYAQRCR
jgi:hypothetical protein